MNVPARRRLLLITTVVEIGALGLVVWKLACPASLSLDTPVGVSPSRFLPDLRGEARCWVLFLTISVFMVLASLVANRALSRRGSVRR